MPEMSAEPNFSTSRSWAANTAWPVRRKSAIALLAAVDLVDNKMREIAQRTKSTIAERVAVMAALNIAHEHLAGGSADTQKDLSEAVDTSEAKRRISHMGARIDSVLAPQQQLDI
jgi:cell division protein ZapA